MELNTGECICKEEWNDKCDDCRAGRFGATCDGVCTDTCLAHGLCHYGKAANGSCSCTDVHFTGDQCELCAAPFAGAPNCTNCMPGFYGANCEHSCVPSCLEHGKCSDGNNGTGSCTCKGNFLQGGQCTECKPGFFNANCTGACTASCINHGNCFDGVVGNGTCLSCDDPFDGDECDKCPEAGQYGPSCVLRCPPCGQHGDCKDGPDGVGACLCDAGYSGLYCQFVGDNLGDSVSGLVTSWIFIALLLTML